MSKLWYVAIVTVSLTVVSVAVVFFARGLTFNFDQKAWEKTGMILAKSKPDGAKVFLDGQLVTATDNPISGLRGGKYHLKIVKDGFFAWEKEVEVQEELVTEVEALLVPLSPALTPLTSTGVKSPALSSNRDRIAFLKPGEKGGIYALALSGQSPLGFLRANTSPLALDKKDTIFSTAEALYWSPNDAEMLVKMNAKGFYRLKLGAEVEAQATVSAEPTIKEWEELSQAKRRLIAPRIKIPANLEKVATASATPWSPDERKFLYLKSTSSGVEYWVFDGGEPLRVGRQRENLVLKTGEPEKIKISWFSDSDHLILVEDGTVSLIELEGTNKTRVYSGDLASNEVFPTPAGDKLIILTSFVEGAEPNLYAISLR